MKTTFDPNDPHCIRCGEGFVPTKRAHGGGRRQVYCSRGCGKRDWQEGNKGKRQLTLLAYEAKPENKERKRERTRLATLRKYGLSPGEFSLMLAEQGSLCMGCGLWLTETTARIDHCHTTGKVRGLLCDHCNWAVGHAKDDPTILRALAHYLEKG